MKRLLFLFFLVLAYQSYGQFISEGTTFIRSGATFHSEADISVEELGIVRNQGMLVAEENIDNRGFIQSNRSSNLYFTGLLNSQFIPGYATYNRVYIDKNNANVSLNGDIAIDNKLYFTGANTRIILDTSSLWLRDTAAIVNARMDAYIVTNDSGMIIKDLNLPYLTHFPVGDINNYSPIVADLTGSVWEVNEQPRLSVRVRNEVHPQLLSSSTNNLSRYWVIEAENFREYENVLAANYVNSDINGVEERILGAVYENNQWSFHQSDHSQNTISGQVQELSSSFTGIDLHGELSLKVNLQASYDIDGDTMRTSLNKLNLLPGQISSDPFAIYTTSGHPYSVSPWNFTDFSLDYYGDGANQIPYSTDFVDYVLISILEDGINVNQNKTLTTVGLLKKDGSIEIPGERDLVNISNASSYYVLIEHRNHLPILDTVTLMNYTLSHDFTIENSYVEFGLPATGQLEHNGTYFMALGNAEQSNSQSTPFSISSSDLHIWTQDQNKIGYLNGDFNMNGNVTSSDETLWKLNQNLYSEIPR